MKTTATRVIIALLLAALMLLFAACGASGGNTTSTSTVLSESSSAGKADTIVNKTDAAASTDTSVKAASASTLPAGAADLIGTWVLVDGSGTDYSGDNVINTWMKGEEMTFFVWHADGGEVLCLKENQGYLENGFAPVTNLGGTIECEDLMKGFEDSSMYVSLSYTLEDAAECDPYIWETEIAAWSDLEDENADLVKQCYQTDKTDRLVLHVTGYKQYSEDDEQIPIDTTLVFEKVLPMFFMQDDLANFTGTWVDADGAVWVFEGDDPLSYSLNGINMTDKDGNVYTTNIFSLRHALADGKLLVTSNVYFEPENESLEDIDLYVNGVSYDGFRITLTAEDGTVVVLTPAA